MVVQEIMTKNPVYIEAENTVQAALELLYESGFRHLPVVEGGDLKGIVSDRDLKDFTLPLATAFEHADEALERLEASIASVMTGDIVSVHAEAEITEVIDLMVTHKIGAVPVTEVGGWKLIGIVSYIDVLKAARTLF